MTENMICSWSFGLWPQMTSILSLWLESQKHRNQEQKSEHRKSCVAAKLVTEYVLSAFSIYFINAYQEFKQFANSRANPSEHFQWLSFLPLPSEPHGNGRSVVPIAVRLHTAWETRAVFFPGWAHVRPLGFLPDVSCCAGGCVVRGQQSSGCLGPRAPCPHLLQ